jgi:hypothetical protein
LVRFSFGSVERFAVVACAERHASVLPAAFSALPALNSPHTFSQLSSSAYKPKLPGQASFNVLQYWLQAPPVSGNVTSCTPAML